MKKKYAEILLRYRRLFDKGDVIIGEWSIFGVEIFLPYSQFFVKGDFVIGRVECKYFVTEVYISSEIFFKIIPKIKNNI